ncbi:MAG TPA: GIY-YIG nuclease family protein, partial [Ktedonobacterales bacterium]|nr:GIY-YIG nuclease family protein [Ktedonobacterales bacterium]
FSQLPSGPAIYALFGGKERLHAAYVGIAGNLRSRIKQHLVNRDSSVTTGASPVSLNPELIIEVRWWEHPAFADRVRLEAAELVAFDVLEPTLRSRGSVSDAVCALQTDAAFYSAMRLLVSADPSGRLVIPTLQDALDRIERLEERVRALEARLESWREQV